MSTPHFSNPSARPYQKEADFYKVRNLLIETYPITPLDFNWEVRRWDGWDTAHFDSNLEPGWENSLRLWETQRGHLIGVVHLDGPGYAFLQMHPDFRDLEEEMLIWAEDHLAAPQADGRRQLEVYAYDYDTPRRRLLQKCGYEKTPSIGVIRRMRLGNQPLPAPQIAEGYRLRTTRPHDSGDCQRIADVLNAGFNRTFHTGIEVHNLMTYSPSFRHDLNLVAEAPDGSFAAHVGVTYEPVNGYGIFEPVCTAPAHRRKGLARSLMFEGLQRLKALGAREVEVGTGSAVPANELYDSVGFSEAYTGCTWRKTF